MRDTRNRMLDAAVGALRRHGVAGMAFSEILAESGAARGAIYHHFPGGKAQLVAEAATLNGRDVRAHFEQLPAAPPAQLVEDFLTMVRPVVEESATGSGCAVAAVAVYSGEDADRELRAVSAAAFGSWEGVLAERFATAGLPAAEADGLATTLITLLEGAHVLCRASGSVEPFDRMRATVRSLIASQYPS